LFSAGLRGGRCAEANVRLSLRAKTHRGSQNYNKNRRVQMKTKPVFHSGHERAQPIVEGAGAVQTKSCPGHNARLELFGRRKRGSGKPVFSFLGEVSDAREGRRRANKKERGKNVSVVSVEPESGMDGGKHAATSMAAVNGKSREKKGAGNWKLSKP